MGNQKYRKKKRSAGLTSRHRLRQCRRRMIAYGKVRQRGRNPAKWRVHR